eukprot:scpid100038/ scgid22952/ 
MEHCKLLSVLLVIQVLLLAVDGAHMHYAINGIIKAFEGCDRPCIEMGVSREFYSSANASNVCSKSTDASRHSSGNLISIAGPSRICANYYFNLGRTSGRPKAGYWTSAPFDHIINIYGKKTGMNRVVCEFTKRNCNENSRSDMTMGYQESARFVPNVQKSAAMKTAASVQAPSVLLSRSEDVPAATTGPHTSPPAETTVKCGTLPAALLQQSQALSNNSNNIYQCGRSAADIIVLFDESQTNAGELPARLEMIIESLDTSLKEHGIGLYPGFENHYSLVGFGNKAQVPRVIRSNDESRVYDINGFKEASQKLLKSERSSKEDGYHAIKFALESITDPKSNEQLLRLNQKNVSVTFLLISDEDRFPIQPDITRSKMKRMIKKNKVHLQVIVDNGLEGSAVGVARRGEDYLLFSPNMEASVQNRAGIQAMLRKDSYRATYKHYTSLALVRSGAMWDWNYIFQSGRVESSHVDAFVNYTVSSVEHRVQKCCSCTCASGQGETHGVLHCEAKDGSECKSNI